MAPPQWAYQVENFVNKPDEELICSICHSIFCDPVICPCDHVFCRVCISKWLLSSRNCPICRNRVSKVSIKQMVPIVKNLIMKLMLYCKNKEHGCEAHFTIEGCESHMKECHFELIQCKNKPCKEKLLRKDISDHEGNDCLHRYVKCEKCGSKMSLSSSPKSHNCIKALRLKLRQKNETIKKRNSKIEDLKNEIKTLKEASHGSGVSESPLSSTLSDLSPDEILINIAEIEEGMTSDSSDDDSLIAIFSNSPFDRSSNEFVMSGPVSTISTVRQTQETVEYPQNESHLDATEYQHDETQTIDTLSLNRQNDSHENSIQNTFAEDFNWNDGDSEREEQSHSRRPAKRRHSPLQFISDEDNSEEEGHPSLPSPKRCWRLQPLEVNKIPGDNAKESNNSYMDAGPSSASVSGINPTALASDASKNQNNTHFKSKLDQRHFKEIGSRKVARSVPPRSNAVFERTLALLEQYNLESDSDWHPEYASHRGDTTSESDSTSFELELRDTSSGSTSDSDAVFGGAMYETSELLHELEDSATEEDPDWQPE